MRASGGVSQLDYRPTTPDHDWSLWARAIGPDGRRSRWRASTVHTPPAPLLVALGDSVASGHHAGTGSSPVRDDPSYGYPHGVANAEASVIGQEQWFSAATTLLAGWDGPARTAGIEAGVAEVVHRLRAADPSVLISWVGYYDPAGTTSLFPDSFAAAVDHDLDILHAAIQRGLADAGGGVAWVDTNLLLGGRSALVQPLELFGGSGWPHPSLAGAAAIAAAIRP